MVSREFDPRQCLRWYVGNEVGYYVIFYPDLMSVELKNVHCEYIAVRRQTCKIVLNP